MTNALPEQKDDFAFYSEQKFGEAARNEAEAVAEVLPGTTLEGILARGEEPTPAFLEEFAALMAAEAIDDDELERQALEDPGADGDTSTPE